MKLFISLLNIGLSALNFVFYAHDHMSLNLIAGIFCGAAGIVCFPRD